MRPLRASAAPFVLFLTPSALAATPVHIHGAADGCPAPRQVADALNGAFLSHLADVAPDSDGIVATIEDSGSRYRVSIGEIVHKFIDDELRCDERVRSAAVFLLLQIEPPGLAPEPKAVEPRSSRKVPSPALSSTVTAPVPTTPHKRPVVVDLQLAAALGGNVDSKVSVAGGGALRLSVGIQPVALALGVGGQSPVTLHLRDAQAHLTRVPIDLDVRGRLFFGRVELAADLGVAATVGIFSGFGLATVRSSTRLEWGLRLAVQTQVWFGRLALFVAIESVIVPNPVGVVVYSAQTAEIVGYSPKFWLAGLAGLAVRFF